MRTKRCTEPAKIAPRIGATQNNQSCVVAQPPTNNAGPNWTTVAVLAPLKVPIPEDSPIAVDSAASWFARDNPSRQEELANLATLKSGELVEIELEIASKNDYEYLVFEDMKPAGFEPVDLQSGYTANAMGAYVEFRDNRVVFFVRHLARGNHSVAYRMRAEIPGKFSALPTKGWAMYAPELKANSDEIKLQVKD